MDQKPWHQQEKLDPSFPFRLWDSSMQGFSFHWHELLEIVYILNGKMSISVDGKVFEARKADIVIINSKTVHGFFNSSQGTRIVIFQFGLGLFDQSLVDVREWVIQKLVFDRKTFISREDDRDLHQKIESLLLSIRREYYEKEEGFRLAIKSCLYEIALIFLRKLSAKVPVSKDMVKHNYNHQILERIFSFIHGNYGNPSIGLEQAASAAALSKYYFTRFFRGQTGQTFHDYLSHVRISRAEKYLADSDLPITEIAFLCGFSSLKTFNRLFKIYTGVTPSTYRSGKKDTANIPEIPDVIFS
jgi:AraC-like DNA-binding protein